MNDIDPFADPADIRCQKQREWKVERRTKFIISIIALLAVAGIQAYRWQTNTSIPQTKMLLLEKPLMSAADGSGTITLPFIFPKGAFSCGLAATVPDTINIEPYDITYTCRVYVGENKDTVYEWQDTLTITRQLIENKAKAFHEEKVKEQRDPGAVYFTPAAKAPLPIGVAPTAVIRFEPYFEIDQNNLPGTIELQWNYHGEPNGNLGRWQLRIERFV